MKSIYEMTGAERAAALLVALGPELSSEILSHLDEDSIERVSLEIARIDRLSPADREDLIGEFLVDLKKGAGKSAGGTDRARSLLVTAFGRERADEIFSRLTLVDLDREYHFFRDLDPAVVFALLADEQPATVAVALSLLDPGKAGRVLQMFPPEKARKVAVRIATIKEVHPDAAARVARSLKEQYRKRRDEFEKNDIQGGVTTINAILDNMSHRDEKKFLDALAEHQPELTGQIKDSRINFETVLALDNREVRLVIDELQDDHCVAIALKGATDEVRFKFLRNMSQNRATDIIEGMNRLGVMPLREVETYRDRIVALMRELYDSGRITLRKGIDEYI